MKEFMPQKHVRRIYQLSHPKKTPEKPKLMNDTRNPTDSNISHSDLSKHRGLFLQRDPQERCTLRARREGETRGAFSCDPLIPQVDCLGTTWDISCPEIVGKHGKTERTSIGNDHMIY